MCGLVCKMAAPPPQAVAALPAGPPAGAPPPPPQAAANPAKVIDVEEELQEQKYRNYIMKMAKQEEALDFNKEFAPVNAPFRAKHDKDFILPDAFTQFAPAPKGPEMHGMYSQAMVGSTVPGFVDPRVRSVGLVNYSDLLPSNLKRADGSLGVVPHRAEMGDKLNDRNILSAFRKLLKTGQQSDKDIDARELDAFRRGWRDVGQIGQTF